MTGQQRFGLVVCLLAATSLAGCPASDKCEGVTCPAGQTCNKDTGACEGGGVGLCASQPPCQDGDLCDPATGNCVKQSLAMCGAQQCPAGQFCVSNACTADKCKGKTCAAGVGCDPSTGNCKNLCNVSARCETPLTCNPATGRCIDKCAGKTCSDPAQACSPTLGTCVDKCTLLNCGGSTPACNAATNYVCGNLCETATKPKNKPECAADEKCLPDKGECVNKCFGVRCATFGQYCDTTTGTCKAGKPPEGYPGAACDDQHPCGIAGTPEGQTYDCTESLSGGSSSLPLPGGYCTANCSTDLPCPAGSFCAGSIGCLDECARDSECRGKPYYCTPVSDGEFACLPGNECGKADAAECGGVGADCDGDTDCADGLNCYPENAGTPPEYTGFDNGYCLKFMRSSDTCPEGSLPLSASSTDPTQQACVKGCTPFQLGGCNLAEACFPVDETGTAGACLPADCAGDAQCTTTACTAQQTQACGTGQTCGNVNPQTGRGTCKTADKCDDAHPCTVGTCTNGECLPGYCAGSLGMCLTPLVCIENGTDKCTEQLGAGFTCDLPTGRCVNACNDDLNCGANAVCEGTAGSKTCVGRCTPNTEKDVCAATQVCDTATGRCAAKCSGDSCGANAVCRPDGRCANRCDAAVSPTLCGANEFCDATGACKTKCTGLTEPTVCSGTEFCQTSTGKCLADCRTDPTVCGTEACAASGRCGQECPTATYQCGLAPDRARLTCQGSGTKRCTRVACSDTVACADAAHDYCDSVHGYCVVKCTGNADCTAPATCNTGTGVCE